MATAHADSWQEQPFILEYYHEEAKHRYTPDLLIANWPPETDFGRRRRNGARREK
jgi:hypothetical protein